MSMPVIVPGTSTKCQAVTDIMTSVALEQTALSHILNAQGEGIQQVVPQIKTSDELVMLNESIESLVNAISKLELLLEYKLNLFKDCTCQECQNA